MPDWWAVSDALHDLLVEQGRLPRPRRTFRLEEIERGWLVFDNDLEHVGCVEALSGDYVEVRRAFHRIYTWQRLYVPRAAVAEVHERYLVLNVPRAWIGSLGWGSRPRDREAKGHGARRGGGHPAA